LSETKSKKQPANSGGGARRKGSAAKAFVVVFGVLVLVFLIVLVREARKAPKGRAGATDSSKRQNSPLTDVAPRRSGTRTDRPEMNVPRPTAVEPRTGQPRAKAAPYVLPADMPDPSNPPQWTKPLAVPGEPRPPDPFTPPEIAQDPDRGREKHKH